MVIVKLYLCLLALVGGVLGDSRYLFPVGSGADPWLTPDSLDVLLPQGTIIGISATYPPQNVQKFLGIPYAGPVVRFQPASKVAKSTATIHATAYSTICPQASTPTGLTQGENCLSINVYRAANVTNDARLPVVVYIHGGGFNSGYSGGRDLGNMIAWASSPFIAVSMNYRLGAFGFLDSGVAARTGTLNLGLKDQTLALHWVQDNIAAFGGDVTKVTIWGDSAGAHSVS
jgi:acetylcholinesterase